MDQPECKCNRLRYEATRGVFRDTAFTVAVVAIVVMILTLWATTPAHGAEPAATDGVRHGYTTADQEAAKNAGKPVVLFRGKACPRPIAGAVCCREFPDQPGDILVSATADPAQMSAHLPATATDAEIIAAVERSKAGFVLTAPATPAPVYYSQPVPSGVIGNLRQSFFGGS